ncbi:MAG: hydantoinase B/oxoprolinase family protein [bacterium]
MDKIDLQVSRHRLEGIADEMGEVLQRTAFSPNIKERRDFSCAITDADGELIAQAAHIPVHLGAIPSTMRAFLDEVRVENDRGYLLNDPYQGGTHLPDLSYIVPWVRKDTIRGFVINRAHHTDIGGTTAGSMSVETHIDDEGFRTGPRSISHAHQLNTDAVTDLLQASRTPDQRITDLEAQLTAARRSVERLNEWLGTIDSTPRSVFERLKSYSSQFMRERLKELPDGEFSGQDYMDGDGISQLDIPICVTIGIDGSHMTIDYSDTADQVDGNINCPRAVTVSATFYVLRCLLGSDIPVNQGVLEPVTVETRSGSLLEVEYPGAVAAGNVETSQRVVDVLFQAFTEAVPEEIPAGSQGTMNNVSFGLGKDRDVGGMSYYETLGGGAGAGPENDGLSCRQTHMTNTQNTPIEEFESRWPLVVTILRRRNGSGGRGHHNGGDGLVKAWKALEPVLVSLLTERRRRGPYGLRAEDGKAGNNLILTEASEDELDGKTAVELNEGDTLRIETPGGGGWHTTEESD